MKVYITCRDGVRAPYYIRSDSLPRLKEKYGDRLKVAPDQDRAVQSK